MRKIFEKCIKGGARAARKFFLGPIFFGYFWPIFAEIDTKIYVNTSIVFLPQKSTLFEKSHIKIIKIYRFSPPGNTLQVLNNKTSKFQPPAIPPSTLTEPRLYFLKTPKMRFFSYFERLQNMASESRRRLKIWGFTHR